MVNGGFHGDIMGILDRPNLRSQNLCITFLISLALEEFHSWRNVCAVSLRTFCPAQTEAHLALHGSKLVSTQHPKKKKTSYTQFFLGHFSPVQYPTILSSVLVATFLSTFSETNTIMVRSTHDTITVANKARLCMVWKRVSNQIAIGSSKILGTYENHLQTLHQNYPSNFHPRYLSEISSDSHVVPIKIATSSSGFRSSLNFSSNSVAAAPWFQHFSTERRNFSVLATFRKS